MLNHPEVDRYIENFTGVTKEKLVEIRAIIRDVIPQAEECMSYAMPAYKQNGVLVYFAAFKSHIGFYPTASGVAHFAEKLGDYKTSKGAIQFPLDRKLPAFLIQEIVQFRLQENEQKRAKK